MAFLRRLYAPEFLVPDSKRQGELPKTSSAYGSVVRLAWPALTEMVLVTMINMVDTMMVSVLGHRAIAAVGVVHQPRFVVLAAFMAIGTSVTAIVARRRGEKNSQGANDCMLNGFAISAVLAIVISAASYIFARQFLYMAGANNEIIDDATAYFRFLLIGIPFNALALIITAAQRGAGNTKISMQINLLANLVNVVFNYLLIEGKFGFPRLEVSGAAIATTIGYTVAFFAALLSLKKPEGFLSIYKIKFKLDRAILKTIYKIGSSAAVEQLCVRIGFLLYARLVAGLGTESLATHQICLNLNFFFAIAAGFEIAATTLVGQNLGAKRVDLASLYIKVCQRVALCITSGIAILYILTGRSLISMFSGEQGIISLGATILIIMAATSPFQVSQVIISGSLRGAGDTKFVAAVSFISIMALRPVVAWFLAYPLGLGLVGAWLSMTIDILIRIALTYARMHTGKWTKIKV